ncbi:MAG: amidophosphoribosyltransferase [Phycisphaerae bacterium]|jgi:amidophosphoribosyltransferase|nr:amidophosphoribosyltransferase [Phycisphaerae bacterium]
MSDPIKHECGLALIRLKRPISWFRKETGDPLWGLRRLFLLMEKQHNRGQDGAGIASVKFDMPPGEAFLVRERTAKRNAIERLFDAAFAPVEELSARDLDGLDEIELKRRIPFLGEVMIGHLRYGTHSGRSTALCHPYIRHNTAASRMVALAGNFNLTNSAQLFAKLVEYGLHPVGESDTQVAIEKIGYFLDREHDLLSDQIGPGSFTSLEGREMWEQVSANLSIPRILRRATAAFDGGYVFAGLIGNGDAFVCRDPAGIRPAFVFENDECVAVASERAALVTVFDADPDRVTALAPGHVLAMKHVPGESSDAANARPAPDITIERFAEPLPIRQCTFERIYFSRGNDRDIYRERKALGRNLAPRILDRLGGDLTHAVFGFIPNTSETAYFGLIEELDRIERERQADRIAELARTGGATPEAIRAILRSRPRGEKVAHKDQRLRTFITHDSARNSLVNHVYDITRGIVGPDDSLVVVDDSIVRGTTLRESIITMLSRLRPKRIIVASSSPPIMYPDCYGIDMSQLGRFIAFEAAVALLRDVGEADLLDEVAQRCIAQRDLPPERMRNHVRLIYDRFTLDEISAKVAQLVRSPRLEESGWTGTVEVVYQSVEGLRAAMPEHTGDWYFTGEYPTPGGYRVLNTAYLNWRSGDGSRAY